MTDSPIQTPVTEQLWHGGFPPHPWDKEWFIALTTYGDRVVLKALPEEYTYDFKTADDTYIKKEKIAKWMQFPDSNYIALEQPLLELDAAKEIVRQIIEVCCFSETNWKGGASQKNAVIQAKAEKLMGLLPATTRIEGQKS